MPEFYRGHADIYKDNIGYKVDVDPCSNCTQFECPLIELQEKVEALARGNSHKVDRLNLQGLSLELETTYDKATGSMNSTGAICLRTAPTSKEKSQTYARSVRPTPNGIAGAALRPRMVFLNSGPKVIRRNTKQ